MSIDHLVGVSHGKSERNLSGSKEKEGSLGEKHNRCLLGQMPLLRLASLRALSIRKREERCVAHGCSVKGSGSEGNQQVLLAIENRSQEQQALLIQQALFQRFM